MKFGACTNLENASTLAQLGYDYIETGFQGLARWSESVFSEKAAMLEKSGLPCEAANCFLPGDLLLNGATTDYQALEKYIDFGMQRGSQLGVKTVVFGSGGARRFLDGGNMGELYKNIIYFLRECAAPIADKYGICIVVEPLCREDCNIINRVTESVLVASVTGAANVKALADLYHMYIEDDSCENIKNAKGWIHHSHIANPKGRVYPTNAGEFDYKQFFDALSYAGCEHCSIEAETKDFSNDALAAIMLLRELN